MNRELPKLVREALAKQTAGDVHPSPDALTAFVEHSLARGESQRVTDHLAQCADCREVVFLASSAVEEPVGEEQEWMPAAAVPRISPALLAKAAEAQTMPSPVPADVPHRRVWRMRWAWATPAVAVLLLVSAYLVRRSEFVRSAPQSTLTMAGKGPQPAVTNAPQTPTVAPKPESEAKLAVQKPPAKSAQAKTNQAQTSHTAIASKIERNAVEAYPSAPILEASPSVASSSDNALAGGVPKSALVVVPTQNAFVENEAQNASTPAAKPQPALEKPTMGRSEVRATRPQWHITPDGHLERSTAPDTWTRVLDDQLTSFHVVFVVGGSVWAGGSGGALFHSRDGGQDWSKEVLASPAVETGTIVSIRFSDALHGVVTTDGGSRWSTSDGGTTWTKE